MPGNQITFSLRINRSFPELIRSLEEFSAQIQDNPEAAISFPIPIEQQIDTLIPLIRISLPATSGECSIPAMILGFFWMYLGISANVPVVALCGLLLVMGTSIANIFNYECTFFQVRSRIDIPLHNNSQLLPPV